ncbi:TetR/AcrR family transcriptional regulator [Mycolicibacterium sp. CBM1]
MATTRAGRPRLTERRRPGTTAREEILDAAAELFTTRGYASTSTRAIADAVGIRQASLYHYFKTKDELLSALLHQTVTPTLDFLTAMRRAEPAFSPDQCLHALAVFDGAQLLASRWNLGALYLLPELREARLATFWTERERLRLGYLELSRTILARTGIADDAADLPFRLVESLVNMWAHPPRPDSAALPHHVADACLRVLGVTDDVIVALRQASSDYLARYAEADGRNGAGISVG